MSLIFVIQHSTTNFFPRGVSDHSPMLVSIVGGRARGKWSFKFDNFLTNHADFLQMVKNV